MGFFLQIRVWIVSKVVLAQGREYRASECGCRHVTSMQPQGHAEREVSGRRGGSGERAGRERAGAAGGMTVVGCFGQRNSISPALKPEARDSAHKVRAFLVREAEKCKSPS